MEDSNLTISELTEILLNLPPEIKEKIDAGTWMHRAIIRNEPVNYFPLLDFESVGKALRIIVPLLGKPTTNHTDYGYRTLCWNVTGDVLARQVRKLLDEAGIKYKKSYFYYLEINTLSEYYPSSFYSSDDPKVWRERQTRREVAAEKSQKIREVTTKLDKGVA